MEYIILEDVDELSSLVNQLLTIRHIVDSNLQYPEYNHLNKYMSYEKHNDIALFFREMATSAVLNAAVNAFRNYGEINPFMELTKSGVKEHRMLDEFTDMSFISEFDLHDKKINLDSTFRICVDKLTDILILNGILDRYKHITLGDIIRSGIVIGVTNQELKVLEER